MCDESKAYEMFKRLKNFRDRDPDLNKIDRFSRLKDEERYREATDVYKKRIKNLYNEEYDKMSFEGIVEFEQVILNDSKFRTLVDPVDKLKYTIDYLFTANIINFPSIFRDKWLEDDVFYVCAFRTLCWFIQNSIRVKDLTLNEFVYRNSNMRYNVRYDANGKKNPNYFEYEPKNIMDNMMFNSDVEAFRKFRNRLFNKQNVQSKSTPWHTLPAYSEFGWSLYYDLYKSIGLFDDEDIKTYKSMAYLMRTLDKMDQSLENSNVDELVKLYEKYCSRLKKIKYENYVRFYLKWHNRLYQEKSYYGVILYKFEYNQGFYSVCNSVNRLLHSSESEKKRIILDHIAMSEITFPIIYNKFIALPCDMMVIYKNELVKLIDAMIHLSKLILDSFIEKNIFGDNWEQLFCNYIDAIANDVLYTPKKLVNAIITGAEAQKAFEYLWLFLPKVRISQAYPSEPIF